MARLSKSGKLDEIIYTRLEPGDDILEAIFEICAEHEIRTGVILDGSGALANLKFQRFPRNPALLKFPIDLVELDGPLEVSLRGTIGTMAFGEGSDDYMEAFPVLPGIVDTQSDKFRVMGTPNGDQTPYIHAHISASNSETTVVGHLMPGSRVLVNGLGDQSEVPSHFTLVIGKVTGVELLNRVDTIGSYHDIVTV